MDCGIPGSSLLRYLKELAQTQACQIADAIQPSHPLLPPSPPILNLSQHQGLFQWVGSLYQVTRGIGASALPSVLPMNVQASGSFPMSWLFVSGDQRYWSFSFTISPSNECSGLISFQIDCFIFLLFKGLSRATIFSSTTIWKHQFFGAQSSLWSNWHVRTWLLEKS